MNWRRGLVLAGINLAIVVPSVVWEDAQFWRHSDANISSIQAARLEFVFYQEEMVVPFDPCEWFDIGTPRVEEVGAFANLPVALLTGWHTPCLTQTTLGRAVRKAIGARNHFAEITDCALLSALVFVQWILVGGFPLVRPIRWWLEPGSFITAAAVVGAVLSLVPIIYRTERIPEVAAGLAWLWWAGLLFSKPVHLAWQSTLGGFRRLSN